MNMLRIVIPLIAGLALASPCVADPASLLAPDDPSISSGWRAPASPTAGLKPFRPAETKDWLQLNKNVTPSGASMGGMSDMAGMKGMDGQKGMKGVAKKPARNGAPSKGGSMKDMPGMSGMPGMGKMR
jgi:hypothetical protein